MTAQVEAGPGSCAAPVEKQRAMVHREHGGKRLPGQVEHMRRVDQRGNQHHRRASAAVVAQCRRAHGRHGRTWLPGRGARFAPVSRQSVERPPRGVLVVAGNFAHQLQEQRQGTRRPPVLQCGIGGC